MVAEMLTRLGVDMCAPYTAGPNEQNERGFFESAEWRWLLDWGLRVEGVEWCLRYFIF